MKEVVEAINSRIKTPYFGYSILAFVAFNWRAFFYLIFTEGDPEKKLACFDAHSDILTLLVFPLSIGVIVAASAYWLKYFFSIIERKPKELIDFLELEANHKITIKQIQLEKSRSDLFAVKEQELIQRAKRDEEVADIEDSETKNRLIRQLEELRNERDQLSDELERNLNPKLNLSTEAKELLTSASKDGSGNILKIRTIGNSNFQAGSKSFGHDSKMSFVKYDAALDQLLSEGLVKAIGDKNEVFELTHKGWELASSL